MITTEKKYLSPEDYLRIERDALTKSEYYKGEMIAMSGASLNHNIIVSNIMFQMLLRLKDTDCLVFGSDMRVNVSKEGLFTYPDVTVIRGEVELYDDVTDTILNPLIIFEVLSPSTQSYDRQGKFRLYKNIISLEEYILVSQNEIRIEHYRKKNESEWLLKEVKNLEDVLEMSSINSSIKVSDIYSKVKF